MTTVQTQIPEQLLQQAQYFVQQGWVANMDELIAESMRHYLESHRETMTEYFVREDVEWACVARTEPIVIADVEANTNAQ